MFIMNIIVMNQVYQVFWYPVTQVTQWRTCHTYKLLYNIDAQIYHLCYTCSQ